LNGFSFCVLDKNTGFFDVVKTLEIDADTSTPQIQLDFLKSFFKDDESLNQKFDSIVVSHSNNLSALVPKPFFNKENLSDYLEYNLKVLENDYITFDEFTTAEMVNVYIPFVHINNFLFDKFGSFEYKHSSSILTELLLATFKNDAKTHFFVHVENEQFQIIVLKNKKLEFFNSFNFKTKEDFIYYILFTSEQLQLNPEEFVLTFLGGIEKESELYDIVFKYVRNIEFLDLENDAIQYLDISKHSNIIVLNQH